MPYIEPKDRQKFEDPIRDILFRLSSIQELKWGEVNYIFSKVLWELFKSTPRYHTINNIVGVLEAVKLEFYRKQASPYEDEKLKINSNIVV